MFFRLEWRVKCWFAWTGFTGCLLRAIWGHEKAGELPPADPHAEPHGPQVALFTNLLLT